MALSGVFIGHRTMLNTLQISRRDGNRRQQPPGRQQFLPNQKMVCETARTNRCLLGGTHVATRFDTLFSLSAWRMRNTCSFHRNTRAQWRSITTHAAIFFNGPWIGQKRTVLPPVLAIPRFVDSCCGMIGVLSIVSSCCV